MKKLKRPKNPKVLEKLDRLYQAYPTYGESIMEQMVDDIDNIIQGAEDTLNERLEISPIYEDIDLLSEFIDLIDERHESIKSILGNAFQDIDKKVKYEEILEYILGIPEISISTSDDSDNEFHFNYCGYFEVEFDTYLLEEDHKNYEYLKNLTELLGDDLEKVQEEWEYFIRFIFFRYTVELVDDSLTD